MSRIAEHNQEVRISAEYRAAEMTMFPSALEERMIRFFVEHGIHYESQKIFYITSDDGWIERYFIADFFVPERNIIIEVDGKKYHEHHSQKDKARDRLIQAQYPDVEILRYTWHDLSDETKMMDLLWKLN